tara:strand:+ start:374 stop:1072 length:699 start_codon:yes stop_codon:yes gene_type:complete
MKKIKYVFLIFISLIMISCGGKDDSGGGNVDPPDPVNPPTVSTLIAPVNNTECLDGENVEFRWNSSQYTDTYTINVKNLLTQSVISQNTTSTNITIQLEQGQPYSWYIVSSSNSSSDTAESEKWKFYLKGEQTSNYAPFPADLIKPKAEETLTPGSIVFEWSGSDVDTGDTLTYDLYLGATNPPTTKIQSNISSTQVTQSITDVGIYYWKVITKDNSGSNSDSGVSKFTVSN